MLLIALINAKKKENKASHSGVQTADGGGVPSVDSLDIFYVFRSKKRAR